MSWNHLWAWVGVVCLLCAGAVYAQQEVATVGASSEPTVGSSWGVGAAVPRLIKYNGTVRDARGEPVTSAAVRLTFGVYEEQQGGAALWVESQMVQLDEQGHYTVLLGATRADGLPVELFPAGKPRWLGVQVEGRDEDARVLLVSVPYALKAEDAAMLGGRSASDFVLAEQLREEVRTQVEAQKPGIATQAVEMLVSNPPNVPAITEGPSTFTCATTGDCVAVTQSSTGRALRATATSASEAALLQQNGTGYGLRVLSQSNYAIYGVVQGAVVGTTYGVRGLVNSTTGAGILGSNTATTGIAYGLMGLTSSVGGIGLYGRALSTTGTTVGLTGDADSTSGRGIMGRATATSGTTMGIYAEARSADGTALVVNNTAGGKLLSGLASGAEKFSVDGGGNVYANGTVTATSFSGGGALSGTQLISTVASGTAPLSVTSNTLVPSLNADLLDGLHAASFQPAGVYATLGANTFTDTQTLSSGDLSVSSGNIFLPQTTSGSTGVVKMGGYQFMHACCSADQRNTFLGTFAGNYETTGYHNTGVGYGTLAYDSTGNESTAIGYGVLYWSTTGIENTGIGSWALAANTTGSDNTASGLHALYMNTTGSGNTASGTEALYKNTTANYNTASGHSALYYNSDGVGNTASGWQALILNCQGVSSGCAANYNTALGSWAGKSSVPANANVTGANNTFLGAYSGPGTATQLNNATAIGANAVVSADNALVLGSINGVNGAAASVNVGIGTPSPTATLEVAGNFKVSGGGVLTGDGSGLTSVTATSATTASGLSCSGCVTNTQLGVNYAGSSSQGGAATSALAAGTATNALNLGGVGAGNYARLDIGNAFIGSQTINGTVSASSSSTGVSGSSSSNIGFGVYGANTAANGSAYGVYGTSSSNNGIGVYGTGNRGVYGVGGSAGSGAGVYGTGARGVYGIGGSTGIGVDGEGVYGVRGYGTTTPGYGVYGLGHVGVYGQGSGTGGVGVYGDQNSGTYAGYFMGNVYVDGTFSATYKSFKIDHPLDPANKYLYHVSVESPDAMNIYNGVVVLDARGEGWVSLPEWFQALNSDFRYQLTAIGRPQPKLYIAQEISGNRFQIAGGKAGGKVSWEVTGIRQDAYAKAHGIKVEEEKPAAERGLYLHPDLFGQPKEKGIEWAHRREQMRPSEKGQAEGGQASGNDGLRAGQR